MATIAEIRQQYPQYSDMSDQDLASALHRRFYADMPRGQFDQKIGLAQPQEPTALDRAVSPITSYPETYGTMRREAQDQMSRGVDQIKSGFNYAMTPTPEGQSPSAGIVDVLKGIGNVGAGAIGYTASPINAAIRSVVGKPVEDATGIPAPYTDFAASLAVPGLGFTRMPNMARASKAATPSKEELYNAAKRGYEDARGLGVQFDQAAFERLSEKTKQALLDSGYRDTIVPKTFRAVDELAQPARGEFADIESIRRVAGKIGADPAERDAARILTRGIDDYLSNVPKGDVIAGNADELSRIANDARGNYAAAKKSDRIDKMMESADLQAASSGSGANIDNAIRQQAKSLLKSKESRGFAPEERAALEQVVRGTYAGNAARFLGKFAPTGVVSTGLSGGVGAAAGTAVLGGPVGAGIGAASLAALGYGGKRLSDILTARHVAKLDELVRSNSPLAKSVMASVEDWARSVEAASNNPIPARVGTLMMQTRNLTNNLKDAGITVSPADLIRALQGGTPSRADEE